MTELAGIKEIKGKNRDGGLGSMSGSCKILKESLSDELVDQLDSKGVAIVPIPSDVSYEINLDRKVCQQYNIEEFAENIILLDTGHAKLMTSYFPLEYLQKIPGFERARYEDPYAGGIGNSIRFTAMAPRDDYMKVSEINNLFCAGEKMGLLVGHTEAICTGTLAGYNAVRLLKGKELFKIPCATAVGDAISYVREQMQTEESMMHTYTFSGSIYFTRMKDTGLYSTNKPEIDKRISRSGCLNIFNNG